MNTREFLQRVVPTTGIKYLVEPKSFTKDGKEIKYFKHYPYDSIPAMAGAALELDDEGIAVYFSLAGFSEPVEKFNKKAGKDRPVFRTQEQALAVKAFWIDIDCGEDKAATGQGYATKKEAAQAVKDFCIKAELPCPLVVDSGGGLHCYWTLATEVTGDQWLRVAPIWRAVIRHFGLLSDPARDMDVASVLRPVGTTNRKKDPRPVRAVILGQENIPASEFIRALIAMAKRHGIKAQKKASIPSYMKGGINDDLEVNKEYPPSSAHIIIAQCQQMNEFATLRGDVSEPVWRLALGLIKHTVEGDDLAHDLSSGHPDYDADETQDKLDRWEVGPPSCDAFNTHSCGKCEGCPYMGKITSPIQLGVKKTEEATTKTIETPTESVTVELPPGFVILDDQIKVAMEDDDGITYHIPILSHVLHVVERVFHIATGSYEIVCRVIKERGRIKKFTIPTSILGSNKLAETLASYEVFVMPKTLEHVREFLRLSTQELANRVDESRSVPSMGWSSDMTEFVLGHSVYKTDGTVGAVLPDHQAETDAASVNLVRGTAEGWAKGVNMVYSQQGMEPMQYALCSAFGSVLAPFIGSSTYKGVLLALSSVQSGLGKTTVAQFAVSAFGDANALTVDGKDGATTNALFARMATLNNIPLILDEFSDVDPKFLSQLAYSTINGRERRRLQQNGELRTERTWSMSPFITSNTNLSRVLMSDGVNNEAQSVRILEIPLDSCRLPKLTPHQMLKAETIIRDNVGGAGRAFIAEVTQDMDSMRTSVETWFDRVVNSSQIFTDSKFRFYRGHLACTMAAAQLLVDMGLLDFDIEAMFKWIVKHVSVTMTDITENYKTMADDAISNMINSLSSSLIVTRGYSDGKKGVETPLRPLNTEPKGRAIMGGDNVPRELHQVLCISKQAVKDWCVKTRNDYTSMLAMGRAEGLVIDSPFGSDRVYLSKGTDVVAGRTTCDFFDLAKLGGGVRLVPVPNGKADPKELAS